LKKASNILDDGVILETWNANYWDVFAEYGNFVIFLQKTVDNISISRYISIPIDLVIYG